MRSKDLVISGKTFHLKPNNSKENYEKCMQSGKKNSLYIPELKTHAKTAGFIFCVLTLFWYLNLVVFSKITVYNLGSSTFDLSKSLFDPNKEDFLYPLGPSHASVTRFTS